MNTLNRVLAIVVVFTMIAVIGPAIFAPATLNAISREAIALLAASRLSKDAAITWLMIVLGCLLLLGIWSSRPRSVPLQEGSTTLEAASIRQRVAVRLQALNTLQAVEVKVTGRRKGAEVRLRVLARANANVPRLVEQVTSEVQDEVETRLGVRLLRQHCLVLCEPVDS